MDQGTFDALARAVAGGTEPRRATLRVLAGIGLSGMMALFGLDDAEAKRKHGQRRVGRKRPNQLHTAGKKHKKHKKKGKDKKPKHEEPRPCDSLCVATGGRCCLDGECAFIGSECCSNEKTCDGTVEVTCVQPGTCCDYERTCEDGSCRSLYDCCPEQRECPNACLPLDQCCEGEKKCGANCIPKDICCDLDPYPLCTECEELLCDTIVGKWICRSTCQIPESICCKGECLLPCSGGGLIDPETCECECPSPAPTCGWCTRPICIQGKWECRHSDVFEDCGGGRAGQCCPTYSPYWGCHQGYCCKFDPVWQEYFDCV